MGTAVGKGVSPAYRRSRAKKKTPKDLISGVIVQLDLDDSRNVVTGSGLSYVHNQADGATVHATQGTDANRPALGTGGLGGHRYATFDGIDDFFELTGMSDASSSYTLFAVCETDATNDRQRLFGFRDADEVMAVTLGLNVGMYDSGWLEGPGASSAPNVLAWRMDSSTTTCDIYRDGLHLCSESFNGIQSWDTPRIGIRSNGVDWGLDGDLYYFVLVNRACTGAEVALVSNWLMAGFGLSASLASIADLGAWWDLDHATVAGGVLTGLTDRALGQTINVVGSPAIVIVGGQDFVRFDGTDDVLWIADAAALDGAAGVSFVMKHANALPNPILGPKMYATKGNSAGSQNGGLTTNGAVGGRFTVQGQGAAALGLGPLAEYTSPAETIAVAFESGAAVRRVDGDGTYASNATAATGVVGPGQLSWGGWDNNAGGHVWLAAYDARAAAYYARPLNEYELKAAHEMLEAA